MNEPLGYTDIVLPEKAVFKVSPSQFSKFITEPHNWYREQVLKEKGFTHNTSSVLGTVVHYCAEMASTNNPVDKEAIEKYVYGHAPNDEFDPDVVMHNYPAMAMCLVNDYVMRNKDYYLSVESQHFAEIRDGYYAGGSIDVIQGDKSDAMIVDYKTFSSKTMPKAIPSYYKHQLLTYAYILKKNGYNVSRIRLVYVNRNIDGGYSEKTGKPFKSYPPVVTELTECIDDGDMEFITSCLELCVDTLQATKKHPELTHVLWHDRRLKTTNE